ncbi:LbetaH domain-containing protein [Sphingobacterium paludis]|uniref:Transferase family hexapeptide repeat protein n=1 Tax=Sphingobacterium paludis TaxID=1476465 RepID=A0A4V3E257_9SPHI|nr:hypothetical protein [Sphingobacterium paludis]TDS15688.1 transferase family hexapeptide repeat protein [Sphingobacterium paludis]
MAIYVYGATAQAKMTIDLLERLDIAVEGCIDKSLLLDSVLGYYVELNHQYDSEANYVLAIRNAGLRKRTFEDLSLRNFPVLVDPDAYVSKHTEVEAGTVIFAKAVLMPDVQIGQQVLIDSGAVIHSNTIIEDFVNIGANVHIGSNVLVGEGVEIGANSVVDNEVTLAPFTIIPPNSHISG